MKEEGVGAKIDLFSVEEGFESKSVTDTRATTDKNDPFLNMGFKHGKKVGGQKKGQNAIWSSGVPLKIPDRGHCKGVCRKRMGTLKEAQKSLLLVER